MHALTANMVFVEKKSKAAKSFWSSFRNYGKEMSMLKAIKRSIKEIDVCCEIR
jgi:hypothetical protein